MKKVLRSILGLDTMDFIWSFPSVNTVVALGRQEWSNMEQARYKAKTNMVTNFNLVLSLSIFNYELLYIGLFGLS